MAEAQRDESKYKKLLFLGPGGSGKSTIFKQLQWVHGGGYNNEFSNLCKTKIHSQIITQMKHAIKYYLTDNNQQQDIAQAIQKINNYNNELNLTKEIAESISFIWKNDNRLTDIFTIHHTKKVLDETTEYFWNDIDRISTSDYIPNRMDIVNVRNATIGITQQKFVIDDVHFHIFDVGGQRSERKKWINLFEGVDGIVFVVSLSCYNEVMFEDENMNRMTDALELFDDIINKNIFIETPIILFLNKKDLFEKKIHLIPLSVCFNEYDKQPPKEEPSTEYQETNNLLQEAKNQYMIHSRNYIKTKFVQHNNNSKG
eukprot:749313_1